jgi:DNA-binding transcriptional regulator YdaS (Cro superfamily)
MDTPEPPFRALVAEAVKVVGSQVALAEKMGRSQQQVSALCTRATFISAEDALAIHRATAGEVPASQLRPDLWASPESVPAPDAANTNSERAEAS